jgi:hypothetical protein
MAPETDLRLVLVECRGRTETSRGSKGKEIRTNKLNKQSGEAELIKGPPVSKGKQTSQPYPRSCSLPLFSPASSSRDLARPPWTRSTRWWIPSATSPRTASASSSAATSPTARVRALPGLPPPAALPPIRVVLVLPSPDLAVA